MVPVELLKEKFRVYGINTSLSKDVKDKGTILLI
jgi:hypothetical protein